MKLQRVCERFKVTTDHKLLVYAFSQRSEKPLLGNNDNSASYQNSPPHLPGVDNVVSDALLRVEALTKLERDMLLPT